MLFARINADNAGCRCSECTVAENQLDGFLKLCNAEVRATKAIVQSVACALGFSLELKIRVAREGVRSEEAGMPKL